MQELDGNGKHEPSKDKVVPKPPRKRFELTIARHKLEKRQHGHKPPECTKKGGPKPTDDQKHEPTGGPTGPGQCHGGCSGPDSTSTLTAMVMITITPSVTKIVTPITRRLPVSSAPITPVSTTTSAQTEMGGATSSFPTGSSTTSSMPTFIAGAARLGREVQVTGRWGMLVACMWVGMVAVGFGMGGVGF
ncbi:hypothetical protein EV426DRAFT_604606 [Tirmania nivea]|nr:hypothetical protein EV426DRAFT_604606 [Tirmania nivea]